MTEAMRLLYEHVLENEFEVRLCTQEYRSADALVNRLDAKLCQTLSTDALALFETYQKALTRHRLLELEAMFQAAFTLHRELR